MSKWLTLLIAGASLTGCATQTFDDPWAEIEVPETGATRPLDCGPMPLPAVVDEDSITYDHAGTVALDDYRVCSEGNLEIADAHADQVDAQRRASAALVEAGKHQKRIADMRAEILVEERRHMIWERVQYWAVIFALAASL